MSSIDDRGSYFPSLAGEELEGARKRLLRGGSLMDTRLLRSCEMLDERFRSFAGCCPAPQWAPGLILQGELRSQHELYLPMDEIVPAFAHLCRTSCLYPVDTDTISLFSAGSWPDFLSRLQFAPFIFNPAVLLRRLATEEALRHAFLHALFIPRSYGGSFGRYPLQNAFLAAWLADARERLSASLTILDAACGCGEGTYEAGETVLEQGYVREATRVDGTTLEPLELLSAAFGYYPNDPGRAALFKSMVGPFLDAGGGMMVRFSREDIRNHSEQGAGYDVILCNGLLGGPLLHGRDQLARAIGSLLSRLKPGGILLVADCFHQGWKKEQGEIISLLRDNMLEIVAAGEGVAGIKSGSATRPTRGRRQNPGPGPGCPA